MIGYRYKIIGTKEFFFADIPTKTISINIDILFVNNFFFKILRLSFGNLRDDIWLFNLIPKNNVWCDSSIIDVI